MLFVFFTTDVNPIFLSGVFAELFLNHFLWFLFTTSFLSVKERALERGSAIHLTSYDVLLLEIMPTPLNNPVAIGVCVYLCVCV